MKAEDGVYAAIDFGSNSINLVIYRMDRAGMKLLGKQKSMPGILSFIQNEKLNDEGILTATRIISDMQKMALTMDARVFCFATASLRGIKNQRAVAEAIHDETGLIIDIISGEREAYYDYLAVEKLMNVKNALVTDIGGGSIELIWIRGGGLRESVSLPTGSLKLCRDYVRGVRPERSEMVRIETAVNGYLDGVSWLDETGCDAICTVGGTARAIAKLHKEIFPFHKSEGDYIYPVQDMNELFDVLADKDQHYELIMKLFPDRLHTITPGFLALRAIVSRAGAKRIVLSRYGVREGYLIEKVWMQGAQ